MIQAHGYASHKISAPLEPFNFARRDPGPGDIVIDILYCGICHSDLHQIHNDWGNSMYPIVPGHEIVGRVTHVGPQVKKLKVGDLAGVGCMVDSCRTCTSCSANLEQYCLNGTLWTYNSRDKQSGKTTFGGYSDTIVVEERFVVKVPGNLNLQAVAPLLCAGITTYSPLRHWNIGKNHKVGIIGLGGLGHMGVKFAHAMGAHTVMITTSPEKGKDALRLGADEVLVSRDAATMQKHAASFDFLLNTIPNGHDTNPYMALLKLDGTMVIVGVLTEIEPALRGISLIAGRKCIAGSSIGGMAETQEMLDFCGKHNIVCDVEMVPIQAVNQAYERLLKNDVKYRFVIDIGTLKNPLKS